MAVRKLSRGRAYAFDRALIEMAKTMDLNEIATGASGHSEDGFSAGYFNQRTEGEGRIARDFSRYRRSMSAAFAEAPALEVDREWQHIE